MTFVTVRDLRLDPHRVWETLAKEREVVVTLKGRPIGVLAKTSSESVEEVLRAFRRVRAEQAIAQLRQQAQAFGSSRMATAHIQKEIQAVRRFQRARAAR